MITLTGFTSVAWTVWGMWRTTPFQFAALIRRVEGALDEGARTTVEAALPNGKRAYGLGEMPTEKDLQRFHWLRLASQTADMSLDVEFARKQRQLHGQGGKGVVLRTFALTPGAVGRVDEVHGAISAYIDEGAVSIGGSVTGKDSTRDRSGSRLKWLTRRRLLLLTVIAILLPLPVIGIGLGWFNWTGSDLIAQIFYYCTCDPTVRTWWLLASAASVIASVLVAPRLMPVIKIGGSGVSQLVKTVMPTVLGLVIKAVGQGGAASY